MDWQGAFDPENSFWTFMGKVCDVCILSFLWLVCSLPLITCGISTVSLLSYELKQADDTEGYAVRSFFKGFKKSFFPATGLWLLTVLVGAALLANLWAACRMDLPSLCRIPFFSLALCLLFLYACELVWSYTLLASFTISLWKALRDALPMASRYPFRTLLSIAILLLALLLSISLPEFFYVWIALALFLSALVLKGAIVELRQVA